MLVYRRLMPVALALILLLGREARGMTVETYTGQDYTFNFALPGTPDGMGGLDFTTTATLNTLSFTPGSVTFQGQPVDFSGTEASFLAQTYSGTANIPATSGPGIVDIKIDLNASGPAFNGSLIIDLPGVNLGPSFSSSNLDLNLGSTNFSAHAPNWNSSVVPELNGADVFFVGPHDINSVDSGLGQFGLVQSGSNVIVALDPTKAFGLQNLPAGSAMLNQDINGNLVVSNIGSSGEDGVSIDLGEADGMRAGLSFTPAMPWTASDVLTFSAIGQVGGTAGQDIGQLTIQGSTPGDLEVLPNFSGVGSTGYSRTLLLNGTTVFSDTGASGLAFTLPHIDDFSVLGGIDPGPFNPTEWQMVLPTPQPVTIPGGPTINADRLIVTPDNPTQWIDFFSGTTIQGTNLSEFQIVDEALLFGGFQNRALGQAQMSSSGRDHLTVSNIGSSGQDGVSIDLEEIPNIGSSGLDGVVLPTEPVDASGVGSGLLYSGFGIVDGAPPILLSNLLLQGGGSDYDLLGDFSGIGATQLRLTIFDGLNPVVDLFGPPGSAGSPTFLGTLAGLGPDPPTINRHGYLTVSNIGSSGEDGVSIDLEFQGDFLFTDTAFNDFIGNRIRLQGEGFSGNVDALTQFDIRGFNLDEIVFLTQVFVIPEPSTLMLLGVGQLGLLCCCSRRRRRGGQSPRAA